MILIQTLISQDISREHFYIKKDILFSQIINCLKINFYFTNE